MADYAGPKEVSTIRATSILAGLLIALGLGLPGGAALAAAASQAKRLASNPATISQRIQPAPGSETPMVDNSATVGHMPRDDSFAVPDVGQAASEEAAMPYIPDPASTGAGQSRIEGVRARQEQALMAIDGVVGVGPGRTATGDDAIVLYLRDASVRQRVPEQVEGYPIETVVTGEIDAYSVPGDIRDSPQTP